MKWMLPVIGGVVTSYFGFGIDTAVFWCQAIVIGVIVGMLP